MLADLNTSKPPLAQGEPLGQQLVLAMRQLQAFGQGEGISRPSQQGGQQRQTQPRSPVQTPLEHWLWLLLQRGIKELQGAPAPQCSQGLGPRFALKQQLKLHAQARAQCRRGLIRRVTGLPAPGPCRQGGSHLQPGLGCKLESEPRGIASPPHQAGRIVGHTAGVQQAQLPALQILLTAMGIQQNRGSAAGRIEQQRHGIDGEVAPRQVVLQRTESHHGVVAQLGVLLMPGSGHVKQHGHLPDPQLKFDGAVGVVLPGCHDSRQALNQRRRRALKHKIEIRKTAPGIVVNPMQQQVPHRPTHERQPLGSCSSTQQTRQFSWHTRQLRGQQRRDHQT